MSKPKEEYVSRWFWKDPQPASKVVIDYKLHEIDSHREEPRRAIRNAGAAIVAPQEQLDAKNHLQDKR